MSAEFFRTHYNRHDRALKRAQDALEKAQEAHRAIVRFGEELKRMTSGFGFRSLRSKDGIIQTFWAQEFDDRERGDAAQLKRGSLSEALRVCCPVCKTRNPVYVLMEEFGTYGGNGKDLPTAEVCYSFCTRCTQLHKVPHPRAR